MHVDGCFKFKRYHTLERYNKQNFVLYICTIRMMIKYKYTYKYRYVYDKKYTDILKYS